MLEVNMRQEVTIDTANPPTMVRLVIHSMFNEDLCKEHFKSLVHKDGNFWRISFTYPLAIEKAPENAKCAECNR